MNSLESTNTALGVGRSALGPEDSSDHAFDLEGHIYGERGIRNAELGTSEGIPRGQALELALEVCKLFEGSVHTIEPCGDVIDEALIRVGEIELRCLPIVATHDDFGYVKDTGNLQERRVRELIKLGDLSYRHDSHPVIGERVQMLRYKGYRLSIRIEAAQ